MVRRALPLTATALLPAIALAACNALVGLDGLVADRDTGADACVGCDAARDGARDGAASPGVRVPRPEGGSYGIDPYETTFGEYRAWLATGPSVAGQPADCAWNDTFEPGVFSPQVLSVMNDAGLPRDEGCTRDAMRAVADQRPVVCVDWCDAMAYCALTGRRLCGEIGGGTYDFRDLAPAKDPTKSAWYRACSNGGERAYPYGATYVAGRCNDENSITQVVGHYPECEGGVPGLFDMSGNVAEWENACAFLDDQPMLQNCLQRGGAYFSDSTHLRCDDTRPLGRGFLSTSTGFRCCAD